MGSILTEARRQAMAKTAEARREEDRRAVQKDLAILRQIVEKKPVPRPVEEPKKR